MHVLKNAISLMQRKKLYSCLSSLPKHIKLANLSFVKGSLVTGVPVPCGVCGPETILLSTIFRGWILSVSSGTIKCIVTGGRKYSADLLLQMQ